MSNIPEMKALTDLKPFRLWCQKVLPLTYDDSLSYYELLCKVVEHLNNAVDDIKILYDYVETYFSGLDVQEEINKGLDKMASDGTLSRLIRPDVDDWFAENNNTVIKPTVNEWLRDNSATAMQPAINLWMNQNISPELIAPTVTEWLEENIDTTELPIDSSLTIEDAAADAAKTGDIRGNVVDYGMWDVLQHKRKVSETIFGVTFSWNGESCLVTGTGTGGEGDSPSFNNLLVSQNELPLGILPNTDYEVFYERSSGSSGIVQLNIIWYNGNVIVRDDYYKENVIFRSPSSITGVIIRLYVPAGYTANESVYNVHLCTAVKSNAYYKYIGALSANSSLNNTPLNTISVDSGNVQDSPEPGTAGFVITMGRSLSAKTQFWISYLGGKVWYRRGLAETWYSWTTGAGSDANTINGKLLSVGNSILTGAVYTNGTLDHLAGYGSSPYSVVATGLDIAESNVTNILKSSTGILYDAGQGNFLNTIKNTDITGYDFILTHFWTQDMNATFPVGTLNSTAGDGTLVGAILELLAYMKTNNGKCQLLLCSVPPSSTSIYGNNVFTGQYPNGSSIAQLDTVMKQLAAREHFRYADWQDLNMSYYYQNYTDGSNVHLNSDAGYRTLGEYLVAKLNHV